MSWFQFQFPLSENNPNGWQNNRLRHTNGSFGNLEAMGHGLSSIFTMRRSQHSGDGLQNGSQAMSWALGKHAENEPAETPHDPAEEPTQDHTTEPSPTEPGTHGESGAESTQTQTHEPEVDPEIDPEMDPNTDGAGTAGESNLPRPNWGQPDTNWGPGQIPGYPYPPNNAIQNPWAKFGYGDVYNRYIVSPQICDPNDPTMGIPIPSNTRAMMKELNQQTAAASKIAHDGIAAADAAKAEEAAKTGEGAYIPNGPEAAQPDGSSHSDAQPMAKNRKEAASKALGLLILVGHDGAVQPSDFQEALNSPEAANDPKVRESIEFIHANMRTLAGTMGENNTMLTYEELKFIKDKVDKGAWQSLDQALDYGAERKLMRLVVKNGEAESWLTPGDENLELDGGGDYDQLKEAIGDDPYTLGKLDMLREHFKEFQTALDTGDDGGNIFSNTFNPNKDNWWNWTDGDEMPDGYCEDILKAVENGWSFNQILEKNKDVWEMGETPIANW